MTTIDRLKAFRKELKEYVEQMGYSKPVQQAVASACLTKFDTHFPEIKEESRCNPQKRN